MRVLGLIPARGGSKGIPRKNIRELGGKPLLQFTAEVALASKKLSKVVLSTDDDEIAILGRRYGLEVPFLRPQELATDKTPMLPVVQHAIHWHESHSDYFDAVCLLQPTSPFRRVEDIDACIDLLDNETVDAIVTVLPVPSKYNPYWVYLKDEIERLHLFSGENEPVTRRQDLPVAYHREGSIYVTRRDVVMIQNSLYGEHLLGHVVSLERYVNIDSPDDWQYAESLYHKLLNSEN